MRVNDLNGQRFGRLTVIERAENTRTGQAQWECLCTCGKRVILPASHLRTMNTQSCGCLMLEINRKRMTTHGMSKTDTYKTWLNLRRRCTDPNHERYPLYGGRGIKVCERWNSFENFLADMGEKPKGMSIERKDTDGDYEPGNCIWATQKQQMNNTRSSRLITFKGKTKTLKQWSEELKINYPALLARLDKCGWTVERAFTTPVMTPSEAGKS